MKKNCVSSCLFTKTIQTVSGVLPVSYVKVIIALSTQAKRPWFEAKHLPSFSTEVRNERNYMYTYRHAILLHLF